MIGLLAGYSLLICLLATFLYPG